jgi:hypothetical protein
VDHVLLFEDGKKIRTSLVNVQEEGHKIALEGHRLRPGRSAGSSVEAAGEAVWGRWLRAPRALELLGLDPELGRVHAQLPGRLAGQRGGLLGARHLGEDQGHPRVRVGAAAGGGQVLVAERLLEHEGQQGTGPPRAGR